MRTPRTSSIVAVGLCGALWVGGGAAVASAVVTAPARTISSDVELVVTPQVRYLNTALNVDAHKTFFAPPNRVAKWKISFGDKHTKSGTSTRIPKLTHTYRKTGHYTARLDVTDARGARQSVTYGFSVVRKPVKKASPAADVSSAAPSSDAPTKVAPIAAPSPSTTRSPTPSPTPAPSYDPTSPTGTPTTTAATTTAATTTTTGGGSTTTATCAITSLVCAAYSSSAPGGSTAGITALALIGLAILSTPVTVSIVRRRRS